MTPHSIQNQLLGSLPSADWHRLSQHLERVDLRAGAVLYEAGVTLRHVYFPVSATVSLMTSMHDGGSAEVAIVGNEGVIGICAFMGGGPSMSRAVVHTPGGGFRMSAAAISSASKESAPIMQALLRYTQFLFTQMAQTSACNRHHPLEQRLCRWLLDHDAYGTGTAVQATHDAIADMLGVRREGVTAGAMKLKGAGLIRYHRGRVTILDRQALRAKCCECHGVIEQAFDSLRKVASRTCSPQLLAA